MATEPASPPAPGYTTSCKLKVDWIMTRRGTFVLTGAQQGFTWDFSVWRCTGDNDSDRIGCFTVNRRYVDSALEVAEQWFDDHLRDHKLQVAGLPTDKLEPTRWSTGKTTRIRRTLTFEPIGHGSDSDTPEEAAATTPDTANT